MFSARQRGQGGSGSACALFRGLCGSSGVFAWRAVPRNGGTVAGGVISWRRRVSRYTQCCARVPAQRQRGQWQSVCGLCFCRERTCLGNGRTWQALGTGSRRPRGSHVVRGLLAAVVRHLKSHVGLMQAVSSPPERRGGGEAAQILSRIGWGLSAFRFCARCKEGRFTCCRKQTWVLSFLWHREAFIP